MKARFGVVVRSACVAFLLVTGAASSAFALDAFWQGRRGPAWDQGINPNSGLSNWYSKPPLQGRARRVPKGTAIFADGAREYDLQIRQGRDIDKMVIRPSSKRYTFRIRKFLNVQGAGIFNQNPTPPLFTVLGEETVAGGAYMAFRNAARLSSSGNWPSALIRIKPRGSVTLDGTSNGGRAEIVNESGSIDFAGDASAGRMKITNIARPDFPNDAIIRFYDRSTGANARFFNRKGGMLNFSSTTGPAGEGVSAGLIDSNGSLDVGGVALQVKDSLTLGTDGALSIDRFGDEHGSIRVKNDARLGGAIVTTGFFTGLGRYTLIRTEGRRIGRFDREFLNGGRLIYGPKTVVLVID